MRVLSIDVGLKRIGLAYCVNNIVVPLDAVVRKNRNQASKEVKQILNEYKIDVIVAGVPKGGKSEEEMSIRVKHFINLLNFNGKIFYQDEYGSSYEAKEISKGVFRHKKDGKIDSLPAKLILERWISYDNSIFSK